MTPAIERLLQLAEVARTRIQSLSPVADALVYELADAIDAVDAELNKSPAEQHQERLEEVLEWNR